MYSEYMRYHQRQMVSSFSENSPHSMQGEEFQLVRYIEPPIRSLIDRYLGTTLLMKGQTFEDYNFFIQIPFLSKIVDLESKSNLVCTANIEDPSD